MLQVLELCQIFAITPAKKACKQRYRPTADIIRDLLAQRTASKHTNYFQLPSTHLVIQQLLPSCDNLNIFFVLLLS